MQQELAPGDMEVTVAGQGPHTRSNVVRGRGRRTAAVRLGMAALAAPLVLGLAVGGASPASARSKAPTETGLEPTHSGSPSAITRIIGAQTAWERGLTGRGVDVAVIDTGVTRVPGLNQPGQVIDGPDLSFDAGTGGPPGVDAFGHGTFMAGIIAGRDAGVSASAVGCSACRNASGYSDTSAYVGVAPQARIVNVKVGAADGASDITQVIAAVDWVTQHAHDPGMNIRVLSLSYGIDSAQPYTVDPLAQAVEQAWHHGILVVVSAGNEGRAAPQLADPAYDPYVIAVGGLDSRKPDTTSDDTVATFAQHGTAERPVDVIAPAVSVLGLRVPGSFVDSMHSNKGRVGDRFQRGSGTSQAAAAVSGAAALLLERYPQATPDQVKALLSNTATPLAKGNHAADDPKTIHYSGRGTINVAAAAAAPLPNAVQSFPVSTGTGPLDLTRNGSYVVDAGVALTGQQDIFGQPFDSAAMAASQAAGRSWTGGIWNGSRWSGDDWTATGWAGDDWEGSRWSGSRWSDDEWEGSRWSDDDWSGSRWSGPLVRQPLVRRRVGRQPLVRQPLVRQPLVRRRVGRQPVVRQPLVRQPLV